MVSREMICASAVAGGRSFQRFVVIVPASAAVHFWPSIHPEIAVVAVFAKFYFQCQQHINN